MIIVCSETGIVVGIVSLHNPVFPHTAQTSIYVRCIPALIAVCFSLNEKFNGSRGADAFISVTQRHYRHSSPNTK